MESYFTPLHTFCYGLALGGIFLAIAMFNHWKTKREFRRYKTHLSDKMELEARQLQEGTKERAKLAQEAENLRMQIARLNEKPDNKMQRELEILARAEKHMMINAPGFAPAWEMAKSQALSQLETEERGNSFPQKIFRKLLGGGSSGQNVALPEQAAIAAKNGETAAAA
jgi:hypothetical protein